jgi:hypothetical protein
MIRAERKKSQIERSGTIPGNIEAVPAGEDADGYVAIKKKEEPKEESDESKADGSEEKSEDSDSKEKSEGGKEKEQK